MAAGSSRKQRIDPDLPRIPDDPTSVSGEFAAIERWSGLRADSALVLPVAVDDLTVTGCVWHGIDAGGRTFGGLRCRDVMFIQCDFARTNFGGAILERVEFVECRLTGARFEGARLDDVVLRGGVADLANFRSSTGRFLRVEGVSMKEAEFDGARLSRSAFVDSDLTAAGFDATVLNRIDLHGSAVDGVRGFRAHPLAQIGVDANQIVTLGAAILMDMGVQLTDRPRMSR